MLVQPPERGYACENHALLTDVLKKDWGFKGFVLADYGATRDTVAGLNAGLDFEPWPGIAYSPPLVNAALASGQASMDTVDEHVGGGCCALFAYGFFDREAFKDDDAQIDKAAHAGVARRVEEAAITLLENRGALPLDPSRSSRWPSSGRTPRRSRPAAARQHPAVLLRVADRRSGAAGAGVKVSYDEGGDAERAAALAKAGRRDRVRVRLPDRGHRPGLLSLECPDIHGDQDGHRGRGRGQPPHRRGARDRRPGAHAWRKKVGALVEAWYPGAQAGPAIARVLFGDVDPGGRLPVTFPDNEDQLPRRAIRRSTRAWAGTRSTRRACSWATAGSTPTASEPAYPFGFGRSYTSFGYGRMR